MNSSNGSNSILRRAKEAGVIVAMSSRCIYDCDGDMAVPYAETVRYAERHLPSANYREENGLVCVNGIPLDPRRYGESWCFADEDPMNVTNNALGDALWKR